MTDITFPAAELARTTTKAPSSFLVSICIPTYNRNQCLQECLGSLLKKYGNSDEVEIIVIDNGSSDGTVDYLVTQNNFSNTSFYVRQDNAGFDLNVLDCFIKATGKYIHFLGDDDQIILENFDKLLTVLRDENADLVVSEYIVSTKRKTYNAVNLETAEFYSVEDLFSYIGHNITFMSVITMKRFEVPVAVMSKYVNFKFMHISLILERLSGVNAKIIYRNWPLVHANNNNPANYDVAEVFLSNLIKSFKLNEKRLNLNKLKIFFTSIICFSIESNVKITKLIFGNEIINLVGFNILCSSMLPKSIFLRIAMNVYNSIRKLFNRVK